MDVKDFAKENKHFRFGTKNPTLMEEPFWKYMVCNVSMAAYDARVALKFDDLNSPVWCFVRFGATQTYLPDGRLIQIGGEHEDSYDPDFQIYNDVVVINNPRLVEGHDIYEMNLFNNFPRREQGRILGTSNVNDVTIYGYPRDVFPPTDFHTATYTRDKNENEYIYIIGGSECDSGNHRIPDHDKNVRIYRLRLSDFSIQRVVTYGSIPRGCTSRHSAKLLNVEGRQIIEIKLSIDGVKLCSHGLEGHPHQFYRLDLRTRVWAVFKCSNN